MLFRAEEMEKDEAGWGDGIPRKCGERARLALL